MLSHVPFNAEVLRYVYIINVDNLGNKSKFWGLSNILYVGQTVNLAERIRQHLFGVNSKFLSSNFKNARKILVFADYVFGTEYDSIQRETEIKNLSKKKKIELIQGESNKLVKYIPCRLIILKKYGSEDEQVAFKI